MRTITQPSGVMSSREINPRRSHDTEARHSQGEQATAKDRLQGGSCQTAKDHGRNPGMSLLDRSIETRNEIPDSVAPGWIGTGDQTVLRADSRKVPRNEMLLTALVSRSDFALGSRSVPSLQVFAVRAHPAARHR